MIENARKTQTEQLIADRYRVDNTLGQGGMGTVYAVTDIATERRLALKRLDAPSASSAHELFTREYRTLAGLKHRCIVEVFDYGVDDVGAFYTMELLEGKDLSQEAPLPWPEVCVLLRDAASTLGVLHNRRLVHRDLSPRNLWRTPDGRLKLLDFGALSSFGKAHNIVGTPPFVAPEALNAGELDQRTDLYALGALGYWLLTSTHAYRAKDLGELPRMWQREPVPPSSLVKLIEGACTDVPVELDRLLGALLKYDPDARPGDTGEVIDTLNAIARLEDEAHDIVVRGYLDSTVFVGRKRERRRVQRALERAHSGTPSAVYIEGPDGVGKSRLLRELATAAQLAGSTVVSAGIPGEGRPYEAAIALAQALKVALPKEALEAAQPHRTALNPLLPEFFGDAVEALPVGPQDANGARLHKQMALAAWILALSQHRTLTLVVDDLQRFDEESQALLATLAGADAGSRLLVLASVGGDAPHASQATLQRLRSIAMRMHLLPLSASDTSELLRALFGEARYLDRLSTRLYTLSGGNARRCLLLAQHLVDRGSIRYAEGAWALPMEPPESGYPSSLQEGLIAALEGLDPEARQLASTLSVADQGLLTPSICRALSENPQALDHQLAKLVERGVLVRSEHGYHFAHASVREALLAELPEALRARAYRVLGDLLSAEETQDLLTAARSALNLRRAGEHERAEAQMLRAARILFDSSTEQLRAAVHLFAEYHRLSREAGGDDYVLMVPLAALGIAGILVDRSYAARYGDEALDVLQRVLKLPLVPRLRRLLGGKLALKASLILAGAKLRKIPNTPNLRECVRWLMSVLGALSWAAFTCWDRKPFDRYRAVMEPFEILGDNHAAAFLGKFAEAAQRSVEDRPAEAQAMVGALVARLMDETPIEALPPHTRAQYLSGLHMAYGTREIHRTNPEVLAVADKVAAVSSAGELRAEQLRAMHFLAWGDMARAKEHIRHVEAQSIVQGIAWTFELWTPAVALQSAFWTHDAVATKRTAHELWRLAQELPPFAFHHRCAQASYALLRGRPQEAVDLLEVSSPPLFVAGWVRSRGLLAAAYNALGQHERAKRVCADALSLLSERDLEYVLTNLNVQVELALAEAGLGNMDAAKASIDGLLEAQSSLGNPLTMGYLQRARARLLLLEKDYEGCARHLDEVERWYAPTRIPSLLQLLDVLRRELKLAQNPSAEQATSLDGEDLHLVTRVQLMMTHAGDLPTQRATKAVQIALELTGADHGFFVVLGGKQCAGYVNNEEPSPELVGWANARLMEVCAVDETATLLGANIPSDLNIRAEGDTRYCVTPLWVLRGRVDTPVGALVLGFERVEPELPPAHVLRVIARYLGQDDAIPATDSIYSDSSAGHEPSEPP